MSDIASGHGERNEKQPLPEAVQSVLAALDNLKFGAIQLTVHEGRLVQVDITERRRFAN
jgi:hypothetical protein